MTIRWGCHCEERSDEAISLNTATRGRRVTANLVMTLVAAVLDDAASRIRLMPGARALLATSHAAGVCTALVSGGFTVFAERVAAELGFDRVVANHLDIAAGRIAGTVQAPIVTRETKC